MNCPKCKQPMKKVRWELTNSFRVGKEYVEYDKTTYQCIKDDIWVSTEVPIKADM